MAKVLELTSYDLDLMAHAIGLDHKKPYTRHGKKFYRPYRNYFATRKGCRDFEPWEKLVANGLAIKNGDGYFYLTRSGLDALGECLAIHIYNEED